MKEIKSWQAEDGTLHTSREACAAHEAQVSLTTKLPELKQSLPQIMKHAKTIYEALQPIFDPASSAIPCSVSARVGFPRD